MHFTALFLFSCFIACSRAAPVATNNEQGFDMGNKFMVGMLQHMFNSTGCITTCENSACPRGVTVAPTETNLRQCVDCVLNCAPETKCYTARGLTMQQLSEGISGLLYAVYLDGCRLAEAARDCPKPNFAAFQNMPKQPQTTQTCPDPSTIPVPPMSAADKKAMCDHMSCSYAKGVNTPACQRGRQTIGYMYNMMGTWLHCF